MPKPATPKYRTTNWSEYSAALKQRGSLEVWFDPGMQWLSPASGRPCRPMRFSDSAIEVRLPLKAGFGLALRQVTGLVASLLKLARLDWPVPDYTTLCQRQKALAVSLCGRPSAGGLHLLVDSTGIKMMGEGEWKTRKPGASYRRQWRNPVLSNCVQAVRYWVVFLSMALRGMRSFRMVATIASLKGLPASRSRLVVAARCPLAERAMVSAAR